MHPHPHLLQTEVDYRISTLRHIEERLVPEQGTRRGVRRPAA